VLNNPIPSRKIKTTISSTVNVVVVPLIIRIPSMSRSVNRLKDDFNSVPFIMQQSRTPGADGMRK
jgi:hypothetical protein